MIKLEKNILGIAIWKFQWSLRDFANFLEQTEYWNNASMPLIFKYEFVKI